MMMIKRPPKECEEPNVCAANQRCEHDCTWRKALRVARFRAELKFEEWLVDWTAKNEARRAKQLDVSDLVGKTIVDAVIANGRLVLTFSDGGTCSFEGEGYHNKVTEDLDAEVVRVVEEEMTDAP